jgi:hypothetical protein
MQENDDTRCVGECNFVIVRETRPAKDGRPIVEDVERCTRCGFILSRQIWSEFQPKR